MDAMDRTSVPFPFPQAHFKTGGGEKSSDTDVATVMSSSLLEAKPFFFFAERAVLPSLGAGR